MLKKLQKGLIPGIVLALSMAACFLTFGETVQDGGGQTNTVPARLRLVAVGDTLVHAPEVNAAWDPASSAHDFKPMFAALQPALSGADMAVAVLETTLGGAEAGGYTGYPRFNSPDAVADALQWAGIDLVFTAHNHVLDRGVDGIVRTMDHLDGIGLQHVGSAKTPDPAARVAFKEINGIKLAFLAYTASTNGIPVPAASPWAVNVYDRRRMADDVAYARAGGAEIIVCALHAGTEYQRQPDAQQKAIVNQLAGAGVDIVLGSHPHVIEPFEIRTVPAGEGKQKKVFIVYSLGNLISNQRWRYSDCGLMIAIDLVKEAGQPAAIAATTWRPLWVHKYQANGRQHFRVLPVTGPGAEGYGDDPLLTAEDRQRIAQVWDETMALLAPVKE